MGHRLSTGTEQAWSHPRRHRILHDGIQLAAHPRTVVKEVTRRSASGHINYKV
jgi:hypothetical protein